MRFKLKEVAIYRKEVIAIESVNPSNYLSTENMLQNKGGKKDASSIPDVKVVSAYKKGDILISNIRPYFKKIWLADTDGGASNDVLIIQPCKISSFELYYILSSDHFFNYMTATSKGTKMPRGDKSSVMEYEFSIYNRAIFQKISKTLQSIDLNIETNKRIVNRLEMVGSELFKNWFIDFEFPNEQGQPYKSSGGKMVESELNNIPEIWEIQSLESLTKEIITGKTPSTKKGEYYGGEINFLTIPDMHKSLVVINTERTLSNLVLGRFSNKILPKNTIAVSCIATPGLVSIIRNPTITNQQINSLILDDILVPYILFKMMTLSEHIKMLGSSGSTTLNLNKSQFGKIKVILPSVEILRQFNEFAFPIIDTIENLEMQNQSLIKLRNTILPKLLTGEIEIPIKEIVEN